MGFRIEEKLLIHKKQILEFKNFLFKKTAVKIPIDNSKNIAAEENNKVVFTDSQKCISLNTLA